MTGFQAAAHVVGKEEFSPHSHVMPSHFMYFKKISQSKLFISFACTWDTLSVWFQWTRCSVQYFLPVCEMHWKLTTAAAADKFQESAAASWPPVPSCLFGHKRGDTFSTRRWLIGWAVKWLRGKTNTQPNSRELIRKAKVCVQFRGSLHSHNVLFLFFIQQVATACVHAAERRIQALTTKTGSEQHYACHQCKVESTDVSWKKTITCFIYCHDTGLNWLWFWGLMCG